YFLLTALAVQPIDVFERSHLCGQEHFSKDRKPLAEGFDKADVQPHPVPSRVRLGRHRESGELGKPCCHRHRQAGDLPLYLVGQLASEAQSCRLTRDRTETSKRIVLRSLPAFPKRRVFRVDIEETSQLVNLVKGRL